MRRVSIERLQPGMVVAQPVYSSEGQVLLAKGQEIRSGYPKRLKQLGVPAVYIVDPRFPDIETEDWLDDKVRLQAIRDIRTISSNLVSGKCGSVGLAKELVESLIHELSGNERLMINMLDIRLHDDYTFAHSVNVCALSLIVGLSLGMRDKFLKDLGAGALMHDLGKVLVPNEVLNKPGKLTDDEYGMVKQHTTHGFDLLKKQDQLSLLSAHVAFQHHERLDGSGYPRALKEDEIHLYGRIVAVADVYDAMVSDRIYRARHLPHQAAEWLMANSNQLFDHSIVSVFLKKVAFYPVGTMVKLSNGLTGVIVDVNQTLTSRPIVRIIYDEKGSAVDTLWEVDLMKHNDVVIVQVVEE